MAQCTNRKELLRCSNVALNEIQTYPFNEKGLFMCKRCECLRCRLWRMKFSKYNIIHTTENQEHILFNSLWGSTFVISPSVKQAIESSNPTLLTEEENRLFIKYNALIPDEYNESCIYNHFYNKSRYGKKCLTATVLLTWSCNFRCIWRELIPKCQGIVGDF